MVADLYKRNGYGFLVLTDHSSVQTGEKWCDVTKAERELERCRLRFGPDSVETKRSGGRILTRATDDRGDAQGR